MAMTPNNLRAMGTLRSDEFYPSERQIAKACVHYVAARHPEYIDLLIHIPNEGKRSIMEGARLKAEGLRKGVSDYLLAKPVKKRFYKPDRSYTEHLYCGLWIELKSSKGQLTKEQTAFINRMNGVGYFACAAYSVEDFTKVFEWYIAES